MTIRKIHKSIRTSYTGLGEYRRLQNALSLYRTPTEIDDLLAAVDRSDDPQADLMREMLSNNLATHYRLLHSA
ncbi:hypothetical protein [Nostocoides sp.]|uniref:hypothetical protein n=1 Tax=Nostocoides sp. TaxID=1917966 RepID=UPI002C206B24|nr:hypothetical protein [Tetrasphaera sp.]